MIPLGTDIEVGEKYYPAVLAALRKSQEFKRRAVMKKVLFAVGLMLALSAGVVYSSEVHFNSQQEPDEQVSMTDHSGFFGCAWRIMRGRWVCLPAG